MDKKAIFDWAIKLAPCLLILIGLKIPFPTNSNFLADLYQLHSSGYFYSPVIHEIKVDSNNTVEFECHGRLKNA